ncbi:2-dehydropantoate 2-reductase [Uliginosibacterium sp. H3]|uniref:2-dehydropantoate 2-reductase n=1 Tax=Uliginosibacterium silvisoli TaxID=3114758 RepID=A0ABU6K4G9_9RHOO|nr:2-dehydropantoate 2-reductase [Uliginosibacterium sp. H3]
MNICVYGAGAVGGNVAARLAATFPGDISVVARGAHLQAIRERGVILRTPTDEIVGRPVIATDNPAELPPQDLIVVGLKAHSLGSEAERIARLRKPDVPVLFLTNGIPWWWSHGLGNSASKSGTLELLDANQKLWNVLGSDAVLGGVVYSPNEVSEPGVITNHGPTRFVIGEPSGVSTPRLAATIAAFKAAGLNPEVAADIRRVIWKKLLLNASGNPISALTRLTGRQRAETPGLPDLVRKVMSEVLDVAASLGWDLRQDEDVQAILQSGGPSTSRDNRSSMLQDTLAGRRLEVDALLGQVQAFARQQNVATPTLDVVLPLLRGLDKSIAAE